MRCSVCHPAQLPRLEKIALVQQASHVLKITELTHCLSWIGDLKIYIIINICTNKTLDVRTD